MNDLRSFFFCMGIATLSAVVSAVSFIAKEYVLGGCYLLTSLAFILLYVFTREKKEP